MPHSVPLIMLMIGQQVTDPERKEVKEVTKSLHLLVHHHGQVQKLKLNKKILVQHHQEEEREMLNS